MSGNSKSMRVIFVGRKNPFNAGIIHWLQENYTLLAVYYVEPDRFTMRQRLGVLWQRGRKHGWLRLFNELAFRIYHAVFYARLERELLVRDLPSSFITPLPVTAPTFECDNIDDERHLARIQACAPDIIFSVCTRTIFRRPLYSIPRYGMFMLHEGITPEYRGLHTAAWAILKHEYQYLGYTLFKVDSGIDTGRILCQGRFPYNGEHGMAYGYVGHAALLYGLPSIKTALDQLHAHAGRFDPVPTAGRESHNYTWMGITELFHTRH